MSVEQGQPGAPEAPDQNMVGHEAGIVHIASLDGDNDGFVTSQEINSPRPEDGHDVVHALAAEGLLAGALILTAAYTGIRQRRAQRRPDYTA